MKRCWQCPFYKDIDNFSIEEMLLHICLKDNDWDFVEPYYRACHEMWGKGE